ncbi:hypothetical protein JOM56_005910 [Amanita muscaria]
MREKIGSSECGTTRTLRAAMKNILSMKKDQWARNISPTKIHIGALASIRAAITAHTTAERVIFGGAMLVLALMIYPSRRRSLRQLTSPSLLAYVRDAAYIAGGKVSYEVIFGKFSWRQAMILQAVQHVKYLGKAVGRNVLSHRLSFLLAVFNFISPLAAHGIRQALVAVVNYIPPI